MNMMDDENDRQPMIWKYEDVGTANDYFTSEDISEHASSQKVVTVLGLC